MSFGEREVKRRQNLEIDVDNETLRKAHQHTYLPSINKDRNGSDRFRANAATKDEVVVEVVLQFVTHFVAFNLGSIVCTSARSPFAE